MAYCQDNDYSKNGQAQQSKASAYFCEDRSNQPADQGVNQPGWLRWLIAQPNKKSPTTI